MINRTSTGEAPKAGPAAENAGFDLLSELALDLRSVWNHAADLDPEMISVEFYANSIDGQSPTIQPMICVGSALIGDTCIFVASVSPARPSSDFTGRAVSRRGPAATPFETPHILWKL